MRRRQNGNEMGKRAAVRLTEDEDSVLRELSELRGESVSKIIGDLVAAILPTWKEELKIRRKASTQEQKAEELAALATETYETRLRKLTENDE